MAPSWRRVSPEAATRLVANLSAITNNYTYVTKLFRIIALSSPNLSLKKMRFNDYDFITQASQLFQPEAKKKEWYEEIEDEVCALCPKLTWQQRIGGCIAMMSIGFLLSLGSLFRLLQLLKGNPAPFAIMYTIGNIISISSTCFLFGLQTQYKSMCASSRYCSKLVRKICK